MLGFPDTARKQNFHLDESKRSSEKNFTEKGESWFNILKQTCFYLWMFGGKLAINLGVLSDEGRLLEIQAETTKGICCGRLSGKDIKTNSKNNQ